MDHQHNFADSDWPFSCPINTRAFVTVKVLDGAQPIRLVSLESDGDWCVTCDTPADVSEYRLACLGCMFEMDSSIGAAAELAPGWLLVRDAVDSPWVKEKF